MEQRTMKPPEPSVKFRLVPLPAVLIMDGRVQDDGLEKIGKNRFWLKNRLQEKGIGGLRQVFYCSIDHKGRLYVNLKR